MRKGLAGSLFVVVLLVAAVLASCTPKATPAPQPSAPATPSATAAPRTTPAVGAEDAAWNKVVEAAKKEGKLNFYNWYFTEGRGGRALQQAFESKYGIKLDAIQGRGAEFTERLKTEKRIGQMVADVVEGSSLHLENMRLAGLLTPTTDIPVMREKDAWHMAPNFHNKEANYLNYQRMFLTMFMNTNLVKPGEEPKGLTDLLDPKWKGKLLISDPVVSEIASRFVLYIQQKRLPDDFPARLGRQELLFDPSTPGVALKLAQGNASIAVLLATLDVSNLVAEGAPLRVLDTKEGVMVDALSMGAVNNGPHPNAAKVFLNYILSPDGQKLIASKSLSYPVRKGITANVPPAMQLEPANPLLIDPAAVEFVAKAFRDKQLVAALKPK
ncbi:MAG: extracellular solute-binding protein [Chloroflexi bacterium]|nr:extracellular solute-binding protein [Chloroflexota bacterium]